MKPIRLAVIGLGMASSHRNITGFLNDTGTRPTEGAYC
jgi:hypothetical protein